MNNRQIRILNAWDRVVDFEALPGLAPEAPGIIDRLKATMVEIRATGLKQVHQSVAFHLTKPRKELDRVRTEQMLPLARLTRRLFAGESALESALQVPHKRAPTDELIAAAEAMVKALAPHRSLLAKSGIDPARIDHLRADTRLLKKQFRAAYAASADRAAPTRLLPGLFAAGRTDVEMLDALVGATGDRAMIRDWKYACHVKERVGRPRTRGKRAATPT